MQTYWGNFARNHDPNVGSPVPVAWPAFATGSQTTNYLVLDTPPVTATALPSTYQCSFWDSVGYDPPVIGEVPEACTSEPSVGIGGE